MEIAYYVVMTVIGLVTMAVLVNEIIYIFKTDFGRKEVEDED